MDLYYGVDVIWSAWRVKKRKKEGAKRGIKGQKTRMENVYDKGNKKQEVLDVIIVCRAKVMTHFAVNLKYGHCLGLFN